MNRRLLVRRLHVPAQNQGREPGEKARLADIGQRRHGGAELDERMDERIGRRRKNRQRGVRRQKDRRRNRWRWNDGGGSIDGCLSTSGDADAAATSGPTARWTRLVDELKESVEKLENFVAVSGRQLFVAARQQQRKERSRR